MESRRWIVTEKESGMRLLPFLQKKLGPGYSVRTLKEALKKNSCQINDRIEHFGSTLVGWGNHIQFSLPLTLSKLQKTPPPSSLYEDDAFLIINKPAGLRSEEIPTHAVFKTNAYSQLSLAHRLDKETSGVLILVKNEQAQQAIFQLFKKRQINKNYLAIVEGTPNQSHGRIGNFIGKISTYQGQTLWGEVSQEKGAPAITDWSLVKKGKTRSFIACSPLTGRTHQIRVHLAGIGCAILGDSLYNRSMQTSNEPKRCLLHASKISFKHPFSEQIISVEAPLPDDFMEALKSNQLAL
ncbi:MAG: RluA family pseudouridine synthase [Parachlamydiaceae bacterium]